MLTVVPWMLGAWLIFRIAGTIWPLIIGHITFDIYVAALTRAPDVRWVARCSGSPWSLVLASSSLPHYC